jgi:RNA polymerase sigma factor (sigma-70 family)
MRSPEVSVALVESGALEVGRMTYPAGNRRSLNAPDYARLLNRLHPETGQAEQEYARLRRALVKFFDWRGASVPEDCADEVFDRLAQKIEETIVNDVKKYAYGIARLVALEQRRGPAFSSIEDIPQLSVAASSPALSPLEATEDRDRERLQDCFDRCLAELPEESRSLLLDYYEGEQSAKISNRRRLASLLGVTDNALRSRVQRLRDRLEHCVHACSQPVSHTV